MSSGHKVTVTLTQFEAKLLAQILDYAMTKMPWSFRDYISVQSAKEKLDHQLAAVQGRTVKS